MFENELSNLFGKRFLSARLEHLKELLFIAIKRSNRNFIKAVIYFLLGWNMAI